MELGEAVFYVAVEGKALFVAEGRAEVVVEAGLGFACRKGGDDGVYLVGAGLLAAEVAVEDALDLGPVRVARLYPQCRTAQT